MPSTSSTAVLETLPVREPSGLRALPRNADAEIALVGALLANNKQYERVSEFLRPEYFSDPTLGRIYEACARLIERGQIADPVTLKNWFEQASGPDANPLDRQFLGRLSVSVPLTGGALDYAKEIHDCYLRRELVALGEEMGESAYDFSQDKAATAQIEEAERRLFGLAERGTIEGGFKDFRAALTQSITLAETAFKRDRPLVGVPTGFKDLDEMLGGLHKSDLIIVAGRPSMGKTAFATNIAYHAAAGRMETNRAGVTTRRRETVGFFSLEMSSEQLATRILADQAQVRSDAIRRGAITEHDFERIFQSCQMLQECPLFIDDTPALSVSALRTRARRLKRQHGLDLIVIDYLQLLQGSPQSRNENRVQEVSEITRGLKALAKELEVPVIALSQLSRAVEQREDKRPQLADLRESGSIEQDADVVMFLYREEYYLEREDKDQKSHEKDDSYARRMDRLNKTKNKAEVMIAKQRHGPIGTVKLHFDGNFTRFSDLAESDHLPAGH
ncbi:MAG: replicative DNA helicase [Alphaproteobacteria bacterium]|nr:replicative DNA helicase [Alphaproteobacteria bacterium]